MDLAPDAHAKSSDLECFANFTFDHTLNGMIAACRRDTRELYLIHVERNVVAERTLVPARYSEWGEELLPDEESINNERLRRRRRRTTSTG